MCIMYSVLRETVWKNLLNSHAGHELSVPRNIFKFPLDRE
jgi:hypothetical protein